MVHRRQAVVRRVAGARLTHRWLLVGFSTWRRTVVDRRSGINSLRNAINIMRSSFKTWEFQRQGKCFKTWLKVVERCNAAAQLQKNRLRSCAFKLVSNANRLMSAALHTWQANAARNHTKSVNEGKLNLEKNKNLRRIINRCTVKAPLQESFITWKNVVNHLHSQNMIDEAVETCSEALSLQRKQHILILSLSLKNDTRNLFKMGRAWKVFRQNVESFRLSTKRKLISSKLLGAVFARWSLRRLSSAFRSWVINCACFSFDTKKKKL
jgi:hypothetical protein